MKACFFLFFLILISKTGITQVAIITIKKETPCDFVFVAHDSLIGKTKRFEGCINPD